MSTEHIYDLRYAEAQARSIPEPYTRLVTRFLAPLETEQTNILECGSGSGDMMRFIRALGYKKVFGMDINPSALTRSGERGFTAVATVHHEPFATGSMDACVSFHVLEHTVGQEKDDVIPDLHAVFIELARITKDGGRSLHVFPNPWINRREGALIDTIKEEKLKSRSITEFPRAILSAWREAGILHPHRLTKQMIREALNTTPWRIEKFDSLFVAQEGGRSWVLELEKANNQT